MGSSFATRFIAEQRQSGSKKLLLIAKRESTTLRDKLYCFTKLMIVGTKEYRQPESCGFQYVVDAHAKTPADISYVGILI